jgi:hypothetical protein
MWGHNMGEIEHFIPGRQKIRGIPLERYLQLLPGNVATKYVATYTRPEELVLDPFAHTETLLLEAATEGRRGVASNFNPINTLLVQGLVTLPSPQEIDAATTRLGDSLKRGVPLREHINQLYATTCHRCLEPVPVEYFVWEGEEGGPVEKYYHCSHCATDGQFPVEEADLEALGKIERQGVHYWYLMERLAQPHEPERRLAQELLGLYTPRNLYALTDLSMKIETLLADSPTQGALQLILLACLDTCSKLDMSSVPRPTALHLHAPSRFVERNVWHAFEEAYRQVRQLSPPSALTLSPHLEGLINEGMGQAVVINEPLLKLATMLPPASVSLVLTAPRTYYRPFWTLSYLWSGWLWGREKAALFRRLLSRKIMGWSWYRRRLSAALRALHRPLRLQGKMVFILDTADLTHITNLVLAAVDAGFKLERILYQPQDIHPPKEPLRGMEGAYRLAFTRDERAEQKPQKPSLGRLAGALQRGALRATRELLRERGEALHFSWLHSAIYQRWGRDDLLRDTMALEKKLPVADFLGEQIETALQEGLTKGSLELLPEAPDAGKGPRVWWLRGKGYPPRPLGDRVEQAVYDTLREEPDLAYDPLRESIYALFPGLFTPGPALVEGCLYSYGLEDEASGLYRLHAGDNEKRRESARAEVLSLLVGLGHRLGYQVSLGRRKGHRESGLPELLARSDRGWRPRLRKGVDVAWREGNGARHLFTFRQTTVWGDILSGKGWGEGRRYMVIPDRRVELLRFRMESELLLRRAVTEGEWQFIKVSHLRALAGREELDRRDLAQIVGLEPLIESPEAQLPLFS